jgi:hypothetical protein
MIDGCVNFQPYDDFSRESSSVPVEAHFEAHGRAEAYSVYKHWFALVFSTTQLEFEAQQVIAHKRPNAASGRNGRRSLAVSNKSRL